MDIKTRNVPASRVRLGEPDLAWDVLTQQVYHLGPRDVTPRAP